MILIGTGKETLEPKSGFENMSRCTPDFRSVSEPPMPI